MTSNQEVADEATMRHPYPSLRAQRSNPFHGITDSWIASSQALLAMTIDGELCDEPEIVGWVERSETHHLNVVDGYRSIHPTNE
ncbi:hypothetical protein [Bradyrhizobium sp.]|uniref:hypothetical protein n=1 Tax=Bradyrhizobium sp. TaxID=376 RepID=UPI003C76E606